MVDNRSTGFLGLGGFNFKSGDASGMANKTQDDKMGQGGEYFAQDQREPEEEEKRENIFIDRSAQLRGALDSLALLNASRIKKSNILDKEEKEDEDKEKKKKSKKELTHLIDDFEKK